MNKFKVGDKVRRLNYSSTLTIGEIYIVEHIIDEDHIRVEGSESGYMSYYFELVSDNEIIRKEITDAVDILEKYEVDVVTYAGVEGRTQVSRQRGGTTTLQQFLDEHYSLKTSQQLEIESIRKEQEKLAARLKDLEA